METTEERKQQLFKTTLKAFIKYDETTDTEKAVNCWREYKGLVRAVMIMGWEPEFIKYALKNGWDVTLP